MEPIFDLQKIRTLLDAEPWEEDKYNNSETRRIFIGTVFSLMPSGKYYVPWACGNVTEEEAAKDEEWQEQATNELATINCWLTSGEGDPCDLFVGECRDIEMEEDKEVVDVTT